MTAPLVTNTSNSSEDISDEEAVLLQEAETNALIMSATKGASIEDLSIEEMCRLFPRSEDSIREHEDVLQSVDKSHSWSWSKDELWEQAVAAGDKQPPVDLQQANLSTVFLDFVKKSAADVRSCA